MIYQIQLRHLHQRIVEDKNSEIGKHLFAAFSKPTEISNKSSYSLFAGGRCCCYGERWIIRRHISLSIYCCSIYNLGQNRWEICYNPPPQINDEKMARFGFYAASSSIWGGGGGGDGSLLYHFILFKLVCELRLALLTASSIAIMTINLCTNVSNLSSFKENLVIYQ